MRSYGRDVSDVQPDAETETDAGTGNVIPFPNRTADQAAPVADPELLRDVLGDVLREARHDQGRTLAEVADDAAVSLPYLSEIERGRKEVSSDVLDAVIRSLGLDLAEVLERAADRLRVGRDRRGPQARLLAA